MIYDQVVMDEYWALKAQAQQEAFEEAYFEWRNEEIWSRMETYGELRCEAARVVDKDGEARFKELHRMAREAQREENRVFERDFARIFG